MAVANNYSQALAALIRLPVTRQMGMLVGLAASVALGVAVVLWSREPAYSILFNQMASRDTAEVVNILQNNNIPFKIENNQSMIMVPTKNLEDARLKLAAQGLPRVDTPDSDFYASTGTFNSSQFMESARYKRALETELARTISQFHDIKAARVHLALPRESAFIRDKREPTASVFVDAYPGIGLKKHTIASIVNLVASSIPSLSPTKVTVVDKNGMLLNEGSGNNFFTITERNAEYRQSIEQEYAEKIEEILTPMLGYGRVKAKVAADMDFTSYEQTQEMYNPQNAAIRSESKVEEKKQIGDQASGVPGALSNKLPQGQPVNNNAPNQGGSQTIDAQTLRLQSTKNFELDKTVSHTKKSPGNIKRLTVAILVDTKMVKDPKTKKMVSKPLSKDEISKIKALIADTIGLNNKRGDSINVLSSSFVKPEPIPEQPVEKFWKTAWFYSMVKQSLGGLFVLLLVFGLLRPVMRNLTSADKALKKSEEDSPGQEQLTYRGKPVPQGANEYETQLNLLRQIVNQEPKRVAHVVKNWVERG